MLETIISEPICTYKLINVQKFRFGVNMKLLHVGRQKQIFPCLEIVLVLSVCLGLLKVSSAFSMSSKFFKGFLPAITLER